MAGRDSGPTGILLIDKAAGWTSHDVVAKARRLCGQRRIGHTGTLDPAATGLLVLCLGRATRLVEYMTAHDKRYEGEITLGVATDTDDAEGTVIARKPVPGLGSGDLEAVAARFTGTIEQVPPAFSAIKTGGQRAYAVARRGGDVELAARPVRIDRIELRQIDAERLAIVVECGAGTYIRSLARDIGAALGCGAHLSALRRTRSGRFDVSEAITIEQLDAVMRQGLLEEYLYPADEGVAELDAALVSVRHGDALRQGRELRRAAEAGAAQGPLRIYDSAGYFIGTGELGADGALRAGKVLA